jgi:hypothetical protein
MNEEASDMAAQQTRTMPARTPHSDPGRQGFDAWLAGELHRRWDGVTADALPPELLALLPPGCC